MTTPRTPAIPFDFLDGLKARMAQQPRVVLGLAGAPGSGKSTLAAALQQALGADAVVVPMDGYHLANSELHRLGRRQRKGAPDTFDSAGYVALLQRLRKPVAGETVYAPEFRREIEEPVANAIPVPPEARLVITEGNYLLLAQGPWAHVRGLLDEAWFVEVDQALRLARLTRRHQQFGRSQADAEAWVQSTDEPNARLIEATAHRADRVFRWPD